MRDDIYKLNLPADAKRYARRSGLKQMGPAGVELFLKVNKQIVNPTNDGVMKSNDVSASTSGKRGPVQHPGLAGSSMPKGGKGPRPNVTSRILGHK